MDVRTLRTINHICFWIALLTIPLGGLISLAGIWGLFPPIVPEFWKVLSTDLILLLGAVLTNLAIRCFRILDGLLLVRSPKGTVPDGKLPTPEEYAAGQDR